MDMFVKKFVAEIKAIHGRTVVVKKGINTIYQLEKLMAKSKGDQRVYLICKDKHNGKFFHEDKCIILINDGVGTRGTTSLNPRTALDPLPTTCDICCTNDIPSKRARFCLNCNGLWCIICQMKTLTTHIKRSDLAFKCPYCRFAMPLTNDNHRLSYQDKVMWLGELSDRIDDELLKDCLTEDEANDLHDFMGLGVRVSLSLE